MSVRLLKCFFDAIAEDVKSLPALGRDPSASMPSCFPLSFNRLATGASPVAQPCVSIACSLRRSAPGETSNMSHPKRIAYHFLNVTPRHVSL